MAIKLTSKLLWSVIVSIALVCFVCWHVSSYIPKKTTQQAVEKKHASPLGDCEKCGKSLRKVHGRFGEFVGCSSYPDCNYIQRKKASFCCPQCAGCIEERKWSGGTLWGCNKYPECRYAIFSDIQDTSCSKCDKSPYLLKKINDQGAVVLTCPREECKHSI